MQKNILIFLSFLYQIGFSQNSIVTEKTTIIDELDLLQIDSTQLKKYISIKEKASKYDQKFLSKLLKNISEHNNSKFCNEYLTIGNIDGIGALDTIKTLIYVKKNIVYLHSEWYKNKKLMWSHSTKNPYLWTINDSLFSYGTMDIWVRLTIAKDYTIPTLKLKSEYSGITEDACVKSAIFDFKRKKITISESQYTAYFKKFTGSVLQYDDPEIRKLVIWYQPLKMFVTYYSP